MTPRPDRLPFAASRRPGGQSLVRAAFAVAKNNNRFGDVAETARSLWPDDRETINLLTKADSMPANITTGVWGSTFAGTAVGEFISSLAPTSAAAKLIAAGLRLPLNGVQQVLLPRSTAATPAADADWAGPGDPIGMFQGATETVQLGPPKKLAALLTASREMLEYSGGEQILGTMLREKVSATLDKSLFDDTAAGATRPAGLLNGVTPINASTATATRDKMIEDFAALGGAIVAAGGSGENLVFICSPRQALYARLNLLTDQPVTVWASRGLSDGDIVAIQADAFCSAFSAEPTITLAREAALVMVNPGAEMVGATGGTSVFQDPSRSLFQSDTVGVRVTLPCAWCLRAPLIAAVAATWAKAPPS
jgi:hypothetical protein